MWPRLLRGVKGVWLRYSVVVVEIIGGQCIEIVLIHVITRHPLRIAVGYRGVRVQQANRGWSLRGVGLGVVNTFNPLLYVS